MDNITHSLAGALIGQAGLKHKTGLAMPALIIGANLPDIDAACFFWLDGHEHLGLRRGLTHGPLAMLLLPFILACLLYSYDHWKARRDRKPNDRKSVNFKWLFLLSFIGCLSHPALDWLNIYGVRLLEPFSSKWFYGDTLFIIDVWLWGIMGLGLWLSLKKEKLGFSANNIARLSLLFSVAYVSVNGAITNWDYKKYGSQFPNTAEYISSPVPLFFWRREQVWGQDTVGWQSRMVNYLSGRTEASFTPPMNTRLCEWPSELELGSGGVDAEAYLFWSRAPFAERAEDGSVLIKDARFYHPLVGDRFALSLPSVTCEEP